MTVYEYIELIILNLLALHVYFDFIYCVRECLRLLFFYFGFLNIINKLFEIIMFVILRNCIYLMFTKYLVKLMIH